VNELELVWLAGLLEGEGTFIDQRTGTNTGGSGLVRIGMNDLDVVEKAALLMKGEIKVHVDLRPNHQIHYYCVVSGIRARELMTAVLPYMGKRRSAAITALLAKPNWGYLDSQSSAAIRANRSRRALNEEQVKGIRRLVGIESRKRIAYRFGVSTNVVNKIVLGYAYKDVA
jgi:hypothetical protein